MGNFFKLSIKRPAKQWLPGLSLPLYPNAAGRFIRYPGNDEMIPAGEKDVAQIFWCVSGEGAAVIHGTEYSVRHGDFFYHLPYEAHIHYVKGKSWEYRWLTFEGELSGEFLKSYGYPSGVFRAGECPHNLFLEFENALRRMTPRDCRRAVALICSLLELAGGVSDDSTKEGRIVSKTIEVCKENFSRPSFNINELADMLRVSRSTLHRIFTKHMDTSPSEYLIRIRLQNAAELLQQTILPVREIALASGFSDPAYFCRLLKKRLGETPTEIRNV